LQTELARPHSAGCGVAGSLFDKIGTISVLPSFAVQNDVETGKNCKCAAILIVFRRNPGVVLSYQAWRLPRIVRPSDMPVCGDRRFDIIF